MRISVPAKEQHLEDQHASGPNARTPSIPGQNILAHDRLNLEQQESTDEDCRGKQQDRDAMYERLVHGLIRLVLRRLAARNISKSDCRMTLTLRFSEPVGASPGPEFAREVT